jgi:hypothetical protein
MDTVLKIDCDSDLRRALLTGTPTYADVDRAIQELWPGRAIHEARYKDDDGDMCSLTEQTFSDFLIVAKEVNNGRAVLRLHLVPAAARDVVQVAREPFAEPWQHVERGGETGSEQFHTIADLTDAGTPLAEACEEKGYDSQDANDASDTVLDGAATSASTHCADDLVIDHADDEKVDLIIGAFDASGDGYLNFQEMSALHVASCGCEISFDRFKQLCVDEGADVEVGLEREALMRMYSHSGNLDTDFETARKKLEALAVQTERPEESQEGPINLMLNNPLLAVPFALDATARVLQRVGRLRQRA